MILSRNEVDFNEKVIMIRQSKFKKSRLIPIHSTTVKALKQYDQFRHKKIPVPATEHFFLLDNGRPLCKRTVTSVFERLRENLNLKARGDYTAPRMLNFRHTFITNCILRWYQQGENIDKNIVALSAYVGHAKVTDTYWYITGILVLMNVAAKRFKEVY